MFLKSQEVLQRRGKSNNANVQKGLTFARNSLVEQKQKEFFNDENPKMKSEYLQFISKLHVA